MVSELSNLTKPVKVIAVLIAILFGLFGFMAKETYFRITGSSANAEAAIARLDREKLDRVEYAKDCAENQERIAKKIDRAEYEARHTEILNRIGDTNQMVRELYVHQLGKKFHSKEVDK